MKSLDELRAAHAAASGVSDCKVRVIESDPYRARNVISGGLILAECHGSTADAEAVFIALAHNEWLGLLDEIEALRNESEHRKNEMLRLCELATRRSHENLKVSGALIDLKAAARAVRDNWESGDLAGAVSRLSSLLED